jgi:hypothetical protein
MPGNETAALRRVGMPDELKQIVGAASLGRRGRAGRGLPRPEPGAGSAGPGAAQRRRLIEIRLNSATQSWRAGASDPLRRLFRQGSTCACPGRRPLGCLWVTAGDRSFPPVLARMWYAVWMQTIGTILVVIKRCSPVRALMSAWAA